LNKEENEHLHAHVALSADHETELRQVQTQEDKNNNKTSHTLNPSINDHSNKLAPGSCTCHLDLMQALHHYLLDMPLFPETNKNQSAPIVTAVYVFCP
jgi:hypothetical protein